MICNNCKTEFDKGKFCPECAFPVNPEDSPSSKALKLLEETHKKVSDLENRFNKVDELRKKKAEENEKKKSKSSTSDRNRGILDIF